MPLAWIHEFSKQQLEDLAGQLGLPIGGTLDDLRKRVKQKWTVIQPYLPSPTADKSALASQPNSSYAESSVHASAYLTKVKINLVSELFKNIPLLTDTDPERILKFFIRVSEVYDLKLISDAEFLSLLVSRTSGRVTQILGGLLGTGQNWGVVRAQLISTFLPPSLKEKFLLSYVLDRFVFIRRPEYVYYVCAGGSRYIRILWFGVAAGSSYAAEHASPFASKPQSVQDLYSLATTVAEAVAVEDQRKLSTPTAQQTSSSRPLAKGLVVANPSPAVADYRARCWKCGAKGHLQRNCVPKTPRHGDTVRRSAVNVPSRAPKVDQPRKMLHPREPSNSNPWVLLHISDKCLPAMLDSGSSLSFVTRDVFDNIKELGLPYTVETTRERCQMANAGVCDVTQTIVLPVKLDDLSWKLRFLLFDRCPVPCILGVDFLQSARLRIDFAASCYSFGFLPDKEFDFRSLEFSKHPSQLFPCSEDAFARLACPCFPAVQNDSARLDQLIQSFPALFSDKLGAVKGMVCHLDLTDRTPVRSRPYQCSPPRLQALRRIVHDLIDKGVIVKSYSQYASPAFLVPKPNGGHKMVVDYHLLNKKVVFDAFPMPTVEHAFAHFSGAKIFSVLDLNSAYYQIPLSAKSRKATAFCTPFGLFEFTKLPMGISVGCQVLSRAVDSLFGDLKHKFVYNFMDDLVVYSGSYTEHLEYLREIFARLEKAGFMLNRDKLHLAQQEISFLGHSVSAQGIKVLGERVEAIRDFPPPKNLKAVRRFLGMVGFYARSIDRFSQVAEPLHLLKRKNVKFVWRDAQQSALLQPKEALVTPPVLQIPDFSQEFTLVCDASDVAISAVLHQNRGEDLAPIAYSSRLLSPAEPRYSIYEKECLAVVYGCEKYRSYLEHKEFHLITDNQALSWLPRHAKELGRIGRWVLRLGPFKFKFGLISVEANVVADCLTRQYEDISGETTFSGLVLGHLPEAFQSIVEHQKKDPFCNNIYKKVVQGDPTVKAFKVFNGAVAYHPSRARAKRYLLPQSIRPMVLEYFHSSTVSAHMGTTKTPNRISKVFYWPNLRKEVCTFVRHCEDCQRAKPARDSRVGLHSSEVVTRPMERLFIDFVGPIVRSRKGNIAMLVVLDGFSKFVCVYPVRKISSEVVKRCLSEKFFPSYGVPQSIVSDNAAVFKSRDFYNLCFSWGIRHITTSPYYPQASQVERFNRNLKAALTIYHSTQHTRWDEHLLSLAIAFNSVWHESTAATSASLFLSRELNHPLGLKWKLHELELGKDQKGMNEFWKAALANLRKAHARVAERYNAGRRQAEFRVGDLVLLRSHPQSSKSLQRSAKLDLKWSVPLVIAKYVSPVTTLLANPDTGVILRKAHVSQLRRYFPAE
jgi:transposase InsO family protein